jgi:hypothetical protein
VDEARKISKPSSDPKGNHEENAKFVSHFCNLFHVKEEESLIVKVNQIYSGHSDMQHFLRVNSSIP